jgi:hypothetical protein
MPGSPSERVVRCREKAKKRKLPRDGRSCFYLFIKIATILYGLVTKCVLFLPSNQLKMHLLLCQTKPGTLLSTLMVSFTSTKNLQEM